LGHVDTLGSEEELSQPELDSAFPFSGLLAGLLEFFLLVVLEELATLSSTFNQTFFGEASDILLLDLASLEEVLEGHGVVSLDLGFAEVDGLHDHGVDIFLGRGDLL